MRLLARCENGGAAPRTKRCTRSALVLAALALLGDAFGGCGTELHHIDDAGPDALLQGFGVPAFRLRKSYDEAGFLTMSWEAPAETVLVRCALFIRTPDFTQEEGACNSPSDSYRRIDDYEESTIAERDTPGSTGSIALATLDLRRVDPSAQADEGAGGGTTRAAFVLAAGCWSFGEADVNGATELLPVFPSEIGAVTALGLAGECGSGAGTGDQTDGRTCEVRGPADKPVGFGACDGAVCVPYCSSCDAYPELCSAEAVAETCIP